ncbi:tyrosine-type recombinase/integrase [Bradyrhizobium sp. USDA 223]|uniref:tyrosine-type recombinase/integrase n=1 Tax=Bradyrhizobium sp. USDA 223 TaxID=3156306 RepID=UPI00383993CB
MARRLPLYCQHHFVGKKNYIYFRRGKGPRLRLPDDPTSEAFMQAYQAALAGSTAPPPKPKEDVPGTLGALIVSFKRSSKFKNLGEGSRAAYSNRLETIRKAHGHRTVKAMTREGIDELILAPYADRPGAQIDTLKKMRILIKHAIQIGWLKQDPSSGIKRGKSKEIRAWRDDEMAAFEARWPVGTKQRAAYELMLNVGTARADVHLTTWKQADDEDFEYTRKKTGVPVVVSMATSLRAALTALPRRHVCIITTDYGKPFTVDGFSGWMRDAIKEAGITDLTCRPHGLRKTLGRLMADAECTAHEIMAVLGHTTLAEAERYTREADRRRGGRRAIVKLEDRRKNKTPQNPALRIPQNSKSERKTR